MGKRRVREGWERKKNDCCCNFIHDGSMPHLVLHGRLVGHVDALEARHRLSDALGDVADARLLGRVELGVAEGRAVLVHVALLGVGGGSWSEREKERRSGRDGG